jgi:[ribosomal protein S5]-alanine N-acetyltransferase
MLELHTSRLRLLALNLEQLRQYLQSPHDLESGLGFAVAPIDPAGPVQRAINIKIAKMELASKNDHPWYTYWLIVPSQASYGAGLIGFKGIPNPLGEAEIGYGIDEAYQGKGLMTEAARLLVEWAFKSGRCETVTAETRPDNLPSQRVLQKIGMRRYGEQDEMLLWRIDKPGQA